jgi:DNA-directed RNA polymerase subunit RPC12/RpoP
MASSPEFRCLNCRRMVSTDPSISGVKNRNHCPYCLWSRHVDLRLAGDRDATCQSGMRPIALTLKRTYKKYARPGSGEMMLVHECQGCGKLSINRIAADDLAEVILTVFTSSWELNEVTLDKLDQSDIELLDKADLETVKVQLFGKP